jgi:hypothetical protein
MNTTSIRTLLFLGAAVACAGFAHARPELIANGGFESGFSGWVRAQQVGSGGTFHDQTGVTSPVNGLAVPAPSEGLHAAMTDAAAPGAYALYQDVVVPAGVTQATLQFSLFINNTAAAFSTPASLDWATPVLNQQARVDIMTSGADPFSTGVADILQGVFQTAVGSPLVTGYTAFTVDVTSVLAARPGQTLRLRFAETDNVNIFNFAIDGVSLNFIPAPSAGMLAIPVFLLGRKRRH